MRLRKLTDADSAAIATVAESHGDPSVVHGTQHCLSTMPGFAVEAHDGAAPVAYMFVEPVLVVHALFRPELEGTSVNAKALVAATEALRSVAADQGFQRVGFTTDAQKLADFFTRIGATRNGTLFTKETK